MASRATDLEIVLMLDRGTEMPDLRHRLLVHQLLYPIPPLLRALHLALLAVSARIDSMPYHPIRSKRTLPMLLLVCSASFVLMFMCCWT